MKLTAGKRVLMFFHWLLSLLGCAALAAYLIRPDFVRGVYEGFASRFSDGQRLIILIAALIVYAIIAVAQICLIFGRGRHGDRGFITVDASEAGGVRIAVSAIEQMVRQSVTSIDGIHEMKIGITSQDDAINIDIAATIVGGSHVPTITMNMQRAIRQFVEMNCGVAVRTVSITIHAVTAVPDGKGRKGRGKHDAPVTPSPGAVSASRPVEPQPAPVYAPPAAPQPAVEPEPEPETEPVIETPIFEPPVEAPQTIELPVTEPEPDFEVKPIVLTLDPPKPVPMDDEAPKTPVEADGERYED